MDLQKCFILEIHFRLGLNWHQSFLSTIMVDHYLLVEFLCSAESKFIKMLIMIIWQCIKAIYCYNSSFMLIPPPPSFFQHS